MSTEVILILVVIRQCLGNANLGKPKIINDASTLVNHQGGFRVLPRVHTVRVDLQQSQELKNFSVKKSQDGFMKGIVDFMIL